jgi:hypothetical protein
MARPVTSRTPSWRPRVAGPAAVIAVVLAQTLGCTAPEVRPDGAFVDGGIIDAEASDAWSNPGCTAAPNVVDTGMELTLEVDLHRHAAREYPVRETITVRPGAPGDAITLFGAVLELGRASHGYAYDGQRATFCVGSFAAGDAVTITIEYLISEERQAFPPGSFAGMRVWGAEDGEHAIAPYSSPYFAATWALVPQTAHWIDPAHAGNVTVDRAELIVRAPEGWTVIGPGAPTTPVDGAFRFAVDRPMPLYALSFAASPAYVGIALPATERGIALAAASFPAQRDDMEARLRFAGRAADYMDRTIGAFPWGMPLGMVEIPGFPGGFEHTGAAWLGTSTLGRVNIGDYVAAHETAHHWWGNDVRIASWSHLWLNEGLTEWITVFAMLEEIGAPGVAEEMQRSYRTEAAALSYPATPDDAPPGPLRFADGVDVMSEIAGHLLFYYRYGAAFLEMIDQRLRRASDRDLTALLATWYAAHTGGAVDTEQFRDFLIAETGDSATWTALFDQWAYRTPAPTLEIVSFEHDAGEARLGLRRVGGAGQDLSDLEIAFDTARGRVLTTVSIPAGDETVIARGAVEAAPTSISIDPDGLYVIRLQRAPALEAPTITID